MADMLSTALFHSNRYIVLERQQVSDVLREQDLGAAGRIQKGTEAPIGQIEGAELLITGAVTEFEGAASGGGGGIGGIGGTAGRVLGGIAGGVKKAHMAIDMRVIDTRTSRIVAATSVEGEATDFALGGALAGAGQRRGAGRRARRLVEDADREGAPPLHPGGREVHRLEDAPDLLPLRRERPAGGGGGRAEGGSRVAAAGAAGAGGRGCRGGDRAGGRRRDPVRAQGHPDASRPIRTRRCSPT